MQRAALLHSARLPYSPAGIFVCRNSCATLSSDSGNRRRTGFVNLVRPQLHAPGNPRVRWRRLVHTSFLVARARRTVLFDLAVRAPCRRHASGPLYRTVGSSRVRDLAIALWSACDMALSDEPRLVHAPGISLRWIAGWLCARSLPS